MPTIEQILDVATPATVQPPRLAEIHATIHRRSTKRKALAWTSAVGLILGVSVLAIGVVGKGQAIETVGGWFVQHHRTWKHGSIDWCRCKRSNLDGAGAVNTIGGSLVSRSTAEREDPAPAGQPTGLVKGSIRRQPDHGDNRLFQSG